MTSSKRARVGLLLLCGAWSLQYFAACSGNHVDAPAGAGGTAGSAGPSTTGSAMGPSTTGGGTSSVVTTAANPSTTVTGMGGFSTTAANPSTTGGPPSEDLFGCFRLSCAPVCNHIGVLGDCGGDAACAQSVWSSGESGSALVYQILPGPGGFQWESQFVLLGDGQVLIQERARSCPNGELNCDLGPIAWSVGDQERCELGANFPDQGENCVSVDYSCYEARELVEGAGGNAGAGGGGGEAGHAGEAAE